jgi:hypothetical protein
VQHRLVSCAVSDAPSLTLPESSLASLLPIPPPTIFGALPVTTRRSFTSPSPAPR